VKAPRHVLKFHLFNFCRWSYLMLFMELSPSWEYNCAGTQEPQEFPSVAWNPSFHKLLHNHPHLSSGAGTIGQKWPQCKGLSPTPLAIKKIIVAVDKRRIRQVGHVICLELWRSDLLLRNRLWALPSDGLCLQSCRLATGLYATVSKWL
jgi:hypothetical protein